MKEKLMKSVAIVLTLCMILTGTNFVKADEGKTTFNGVYLTFDNWYGKGTSSISIGDDFLTSGKNIAKFENFENIQTEEKVLDKANYTVSNVKNNTVITLTESYLKTLKNGTYSMEVIFKDAIIPVKLHVILDKIVLVDAFFEFPDWNGSGNVSVNMDGKTFNHMFYPELFKQLTYKGKVVDKSNYSITGFMDTVKVVVNEKYLKTLPQGVNYFDIEFEDIQLMLRINVNTNINNNPSKAKGVKIKSKRRKLMVKWNKLKGVTSYNVKVAENKKFTKKVKTKTTKKNTITFKKLKAKKKYYVKVRGYKKVNGIKYYGLWSKVAIKKTK